MSCSGVGGVGQNPYQFLQASSAQKSATDTSTTSDPTANSAAAVAQLQQQLQTQGQSGTHHHHHGGGGKNRAGSDGDAVADLLNTIQQALQSADSSDDPNKVIQDTVTKLLSGTPQTNGTDTTASDSNAAAAATAART